MREGYYKDRTRRDAERAEAENLCRRCVKVPPEEGKKMCEPCRLKIRQRVRPIYGERKAEGVCASCRVKPPKENRTRCEGCLDRIASNNRRTRKACRLKVMEHYCGGREPFCRCCKERNPVFLTVDHVNDNGAEHRKAMSGRTCGGAGDFKKIIDGGFKEVLQVLCWNCQWGKRLGGGICPHFGKDLRIPELSECQSVTITKGVELWRI